MRTARRARGVRSAAAGELLANWTELCFRSVRRAADCSLRAAARCADSRAKPFRLLKFQPAPNQSLRFPAPFGCVVLDAFEWTLPALICCLITRCHWRSRRGRWSRARGLRGPTKRCRLAPEPDAIELERRARGIGAQLAQLAQIKANRREADARLIHKTKTKQTICRSFDSARDSLAGRQTSRCNKRAKRAQLIIARRQTRRQWLES